jgi:hypothetical protein
MPWNKKYFMHMSREGLRPSQKKVEAILQIKAATTRKQLRQFFGMVNYYRDMWSLRSHILAPLSLMTSAKVKWKWTPECQDSFEKMKAIIAKETLVTFPNFTKKFEFHTDTSKATIRSLHLIRWQASSILLLQASTSTNLYTTTERELLSIVETLKEFRNILLGQKIKVHTDHENLTYKNFNSDRVVRWRLYIEEYSPDLQYIKGTHNVVADTLSRLEIKETPFEDTQESFLGLMECFAKKADTDKFHPLNYQQLKNAQDKDKTTQKILKMPKILYLLKDFHGGGKTASLVCFKEKIVIPGQLQEHVTNWYHTTLCHPGINQTEETIGQHLWWP